MIDPDLIQEGARLILRGLDVDLEDRNYVGTPQRYAKFLLEMFDNKPALTSFPEKHNQMIVLTGHECWTLCPHHLLPVRFIMHAAYIPRGQVLGVSKIARMFDVVNTQPLLQETATEEIVELLFNETGEMGAACILEGEHLCMKMRGIKSQGTVTTSAMRGVMMSNPQARSEFLQLVAHRSMP